MSSKIKILNSSFAELATINAANSASRKEMLNKDNVLNFSLFVKSGLAPYITEDNCVSLDNDYFDIVYYKKDQQGDGKLIVDVECEHISYRLNDYSVEYFSETGTPPYILGKILEGTGFSIGTIDFAENMTFSLQEGATRRALLLQFAAYLGGELEYFQHTVSILAQRGSSVAKPLAVGKDVTIISKAVDKRKPDDLGNPIIAYTCGVYKGSAVELGDKVTLDYSSLDINGIELRIVSKTYDPFNPNNVVIEIGNYVNDLADDLYRIETQAVSKDALMNGCRIGPEYGFEAVRNDKKARAYFRADEMKFQSGDGSGTWKDRLYYEYDSAADETVLVFDGQLSADIINALSVLITPNLYAEKATISELTVDQLDTSTKVQNYLNNDTSDVNYIRVAGQITQYITALVASIYGARRTNSDSWDMTADQQIDTYYAGAAVDNATGNYTMSGGATMDAYSAYNAGRIYRAINATSYYKLIGIDGLGFVYYDVYTVSTIGVNYEQLKNRKGELLYWIDETHTSAAADETDYPVYAYVYNELVKMELSFEEVDGVQTPTITMGAGSGIENRMKAYLFKDTVGAVLRYVTSAGVVQDIRNGENGIEFLGDTSNNYYSATNAAAVTVNSSGETVVCTKDIAFNSRSKVIVHFSAKMTTSGGVAVITAKTYVGTTAFDMIPEDTFSSAGKWTLSYSDDKKGITSGTKTISVKLITDANSGVIAAKQAKLIIYVIPDPMPSLPNPTGFTLTVISSTEIDLAWTNPS